MIVAESETPSHEAELKYCEFCGALWLRPCGSADVYCASCAGWIETELLRLAQGEA